jgi:hypothetical protein
MNYIHNLQSQVEELQAELIAMKAQRLELHGYLLSEKFWKDPTVQIQAWIPVV